MGVFCISIPFHSYTAHYLSVFYLFFIFSHWLVIAGVWGQFHSTCWIHYESEKFKSALLLLLWAQCQHNMSATWCTITMITRSVTMSSWVTLILRSTCYSKLLCLLTSWNFLPLNIGYIKETEYSRTQFSNCFQQKGPSKILHECYHKTSRMPGQNDTFLYMYSAVKGNWVNLVSWTH